jgi:TolB-like protein
MDGPLTDVAARLSVALSERYAIDREIGRGGMAVVFLARDVKHERRVALKVVHPELAGVLGPERFLREVKVTAQLHHPHILPLYDSGVADGLLYYVMPYVEGESLRERLEREKQLPVEEALRIAREVADALAYAHGRDVIHRDIKPENILLESGHAVVADFGIARAVTVAGGTRLTETGLALGTPAYMSPEQAAGERELDGRTDLYSLACVLYEMLAGTPPITGPSVAAVLARKSVDAPPPLRRLRSAVPEEVERTLTRALSPVPADRQRTVAELAGELVRSAGGESGTARAVATPARRRRLPLIAGVAAIALVATVVVWQVLPRRGAAGPVANRVVVLPFDNLTGDSTLEPVGRMVADWITEGLARISEVQTVPNLIVLQTIAGVQREHRGGDGSSTIQEVARLTRAGLAVSGSYYRHGNALEFHSEVLDVRAARPLGVVEPVLGRVADPAAAIDSVRLRVMGLLAARLSQAGWEIPPSIQPPSYDAYRAFAEGIRHWTAGEYGAAGAEFERAFALDSTYLRAVLSAASAYGNAGNVAKSDTLLAFALPRRSELSLYDQYRLDWFLAARRGDREAQIAAARAAAQLVPIGTARFALIVSLRDANRPREALDELQDVVRSGMPDLASSWYAVWGVRTELYHLLGQHRRELEVAREGRAQLTATLPVMEYEGRALAALGRIEELRTLIDEIADTRVRPGATVGDVLLTIGRELRAHGRGAEAARVADRGLAWYAQQPAAVLARGWRRDLHASLLYLRERWRESAAQWDSIPVDPRSAVSRLGTQGVLAARLDLPDSARAVAAELARLDRPGLNGEHTLWRARIAAVLGERDSAVTLLRQAFGEGVAYGMWLHTDMDLEALRDYGPYRELVRPKG